MKKSKRLIRFFAIAWVAATGCTPAHKTLTPLQALQVALPPQTVTIKLTGYKPAAERSFSNIFVNNFSVKASQGQLTYSSARDGMPDTLKLAHIADYNFGTGSAESAVPYFPDLVLYLAGITSSSQSLLYCPPSQTLSSTNDLFSYIDTRTSPPTTQYLGLRDCDKLYIGLNNNLFDNDGDGIPDYLELRCGLNPANPNDANLSIAGDGVSNIQKCKQGIPVDENANSQPNQLFASKYRTTVQSDGTTAFSVSNLPVLNGGQDNFIAFHLTELDNTTQKSFLFTAFYILPAGSAGQTFSFAYWANQQGMTPQNQGLTPL
ncbi:MAG: hypothetical protein P4M08_06805 [Oligoflexia bacterium]|nr:hypothetical protein [Oligoflexia bacterium]